MDLAFAQLISGQAPQAVYVSYHRAEAMNSAAVLPLTERVKIVRALVDARSARFGGRAARGDPVLESTPAGR